tara:strand:+ start:3707 stop:5320 length:1614 start_codon:yes stop_codon:yes gene_type:complete
MSFSNFYKYGDRNYSQLIGLIDSDAGYSLLESGDTVYNNQSTGGNAMTWIRNPLASSLYPGGTGADNGTGTFTDASKFTYVDSSDVDNQKNWIQPELTEPSNPCTNPKYKGNIVLGETNQGSQVGDEIASGARSVGISWNGIDQVENPTFCQTIAVQCAGVAEVEMSSTSYTQKAFQGQSAQVGKVGFIGESQLQANTDVFAMVDTTSGPYSGNTNVSTSNRCILYQALSEWHANYKAANPSYTGNLYIGITTNLRERYLGQLYMLNGMSTAGQLNEIENSNGTEYDVIDVWIASTPPDGVDVVLPDTTTVNYNWTVGGKPPGWPSNTADPAYVNNEVFIISFCNEANLAYHLGPIGWSTQPTPTWTADRNNFTTSYANIQAASGYFGGIIYPATNPSAAQDLNLQLQSYAVITNEDPINETNFSTALGPNYNASTFASIFATPGTSNINPYTAPSKSISAYNWYGIHNKQIQTTGANQGILNFTAAQFATDINNILQPAPSGPYVRGILGLSVAQMPSPNNNFCKTLLTSSELKET